MVNHGFNGLHIPSISQGWFQIQHAMGSYENIETPPNPSPASFDILENLIGEPKQAVFAFLVLGDESRKQTPVKWELMVRLTLGYNAILQPD